MSNYIKVSFPNSTKQLKRVYEFTYHQHNYHHDYATIQFRDWGVDPTLTRPGTLIQLNLSGKEFSGYVHDVKNFQDNSTHITEIGFIGASYVMRQASQATYHNVTADQVVAQIAKKYNFAYKTTPHPRVYTQLSQAGMTDWEFMVKLAKQSGYFLRAENTALYFQPLLNDFKELIYEAEHYTKVDAGFKPVKPLYSFRPIVGETLSTQGADKAAISIAGINPRTGQYFKYTKQNRSETTRQISHPELFDKHATHVVANDYNTAVSEAYSADEKSVFPYSAEVEVLGSVNLRPGMPVYLDGVGTEYSGYWTILSIQHHVAEESLNIQRYTSIMTVGSDSLGVVNSLDYPNKPSIRPMRHIKPNVRNTRVKPKTVLKNPVISIKPVKKTQLVNRTNRPMPADKTLSTAGWSSTSGNLNAIPTQPARNVAAQIKAGANRARN
jgi:hypothetical protein